jgi:5-methylcytosine-specific restriction endonuclease McrA
VAASKRVPLIWKPVILERDGFRCIYCGSPYDAERPDLHTLDHLIPRRHGGPDRIWNLAIACAPCNGSKFTRPWPQAISKLIENLRELVADTRAEIEASR